MEERNTFSPSMTRRRGGLTCSLSLYRRISITLRLAHASESLAPCFKMGRMKPYSRQRSTNVSLPLKNIVLSDEIWNLQIFFSRERYKTFSNLEKHLCFFIDQIFSIILTNFISQWSAFQSFSTFLLFDSIVGDDNFPCDVIEWINTSSSTSFNSTTVRNGCWLLVVEWLLLFFLFTFVRSEEIKDTCFSSPWKTANSFLASILMSVRVLLNSP